MKIFSVLATLMLFAAAAVATPSYCDSVAGNLVTNCGFETGDLTGWTNGPNNEFNGVGGSPYINTGNFGAFLGPPGSDSTLSQTLLSLEGTVSVSFYLMGDGGTPNDFTVLWDGVDVGPDLVDAGAFGYTQFAGTLTSFGNDTLTFQFRDDPGYWGLDDVVATQSTVTPEPGTVGMFLAGLGAMLTGIRARRRS